MVERDIYGAVFTDSVPGNARQNKYVVDHASVVEAQGVC